MTRTTAYKALYFAGLAGGVLLITGAVYALWGAHHALGVATLAVFALLLIPGRVQAYFWSDLFAGLYHLNRRNYPLSKAHSERFLAQLADRPWLKKLIWLGTSAYSRDAEVLARNNLGAAMLKMDEFVAAREQLSRSIALDPECPLPYRNMGVLLLNSATFAEALPWLEKATALGLRDNWSDGVVTTAQHRNAARSTGGVPIPVVPTGAASEPVTGAFVVELLNDDRTPFEFVIAALEHLFGLTGIQAIRITFAVNRDGSAACAGFDTKRAAQAKADELMAFAHASDFPLSCRVTVNTSPWEGCQ